VGTAPRFSIRSTLVLIRIPARIGSLPIERLLCMPPKIKQTVMVVDDDPSLLRAMERLLRSFDYEVLVFPNAEVFLAHDTVPAPVCLLLDIFLPGMSGTELFSALAASGRSIPTVLMTAHDDDNTRNLLSRLDAVAILYKPFEEDVLLDAIARALSDQKTS
jgi:FixJ family two-component response regulator